METVEVVKEKYVYKGMNFPVKASKVGEHLQELHDTNGALTPQMVVNDAKPKRSVLHPCFEWNDKDAANKFRLTQARRLIGAVNVEYEAEEGEVITARKYIHIKRDDEGELVNFSFQKGQSGYVDVKMVLTDPILATYALEQAVLEVQRWQDKFKGMKELQGIFAAIDKVTDKSPK